MQTITLEYKSSDGEETYTRDASYIQFFDEAGFKFQAYDHQRKRRKCDYDDTATMVSARCRKTYGYINPRNLVKLIKNPFFKGIDLEGKYCGLDELIEMFRYGKPEQKQLVMDNIHNMDDSSLYHLSVTLRKYGPKIRAFADEMDKIRTSRDNEIEAVIDPSMGGKKFNRNIVIKPKNFVNINRLRIQYEDWQGNITERDISNIQLGGDGRQIIAYCHLRNETRAFNVGSIVSAVDLDTGELMDFCKLTNDTLE